MLQDAFDGPLLRPFIFCAASCALILWVLLRTGWAWSLATDIPTHRSLHTRPTPRVGGWGVSPTSAAGLAWFAPQLGWAALLALGLAALCQIDDRRGLPARVRFAAQLAAAAVVCLVYPLGLAWWAWPLIVIGLVWMTNLYNFMDGADGLAGGMALIGFGAYALAAWQLAPALGAGAAVVAGAAVGFLFFNAPPARLFLGDAGSIPLGFLAGALGLIGWSAHVWALWFPLMIFSPFIVDASVTLTRRVLRGERFWEAHREHYYQRMIQMDSGHGRTIRAWYLLMLLGAVWALCMLKLSVVAPPALLVGMGAAWMALVVGLGWRVDRHWARFDRNDGQL